MEEWMEDVNEEGWRNKKVHTDEGIKCRRTLLKNSMTLLNPEDDYPLVAIHTRHIYTEAGYLKKMEAFKVMAIEKRKRGMIIQTSQIYGSTWRYRGQML